MGLRTRARRRGSVGSVTEAYKIQLGRQMGNSDDAGEFLSSLSDPARKTQARSEQANIIKRRKRSPGLVKRYGNT